MKNEPRWLQEGIHQLEIGLLLSLSCRELGDSKIPRPSVDRTWPTSHFLENEWLPDAGSVLKDLRKDLDARGQKVPPADYWTDRRERYARGLPTARPPSWIARTWLRQAVALADWQAWCKAVVDRDAARSRAELVRELSKACAIGVQRIDKRRTGGLLARLIRWGPAEDRVLVPVRKLLDYCVAAFNEEQQSGSSAVDGLALPATRNLRDQLARIDKWPPWLLAGWISDPARLEDLEARLSPAEATVSALLGGEDPHPLVADSLPGRLILALAVLEEADAGETWDDAWRGRINDLFQRTGWVATLDRDGSHPGAMADRPVPTAGLLPRTVATGLILTDQNGRETVVRPGVRKFPEVSPSMELLDRLSAAARNDPASWQLFENALRALDSSLPGLIATDRTQPPPDRNGSTSLAMSPRLAEAAILEAPAAPTVPTVAPESANPLALALEECRDLVARLQAVEAWNGWEVYHQTVDELGRAGPVETRPGYSLFEMVHRRATTGDDDPLAKGLRELGRSMLQAFESMGETPWPPPDPDGLELPILHERPTQPVDLEWKKDPREPRRVLDARVFSWPGDDQHFPADLVVSLGDGRLAELAAWLNLPEPRFEPTDSKRPLHAWFTEARLLPWVVDDEKRDRVIEAHRRAFEDAMATPEGRDWFAGWALEARRLSKDSAEARWFETLRAQGWITPIPISDDEGLWWPPDLPTGLATLVKWEFNDTEPPRKLRRGTARPVSSPELAEGVYSLGPNEQAPALVAARSIEETIQRNRAFKPETKDQAWDFMVKTCDDHLKIQAITDPVGLVSPILDALESLAEHPEILRPDVIDNMLKLIRDWCQAKGLAVLPQRWSFQHGLEAKDDLTVPARFHESVAAGTVQLERLGLAWNDPSGRPPTDREPRIFRSSGYRPEGYDRLRALLIEGPEALSRPLLAQLDHWPAAELNRTLESRARDFFKEFWDLGKAGLRDHPKFRAMEDVLNRLLRSRFQLEAFYPANRDEHPYQWVIVLNAGRTERKSVRAVIRPGLRKGNDYRFAAEIELEE